MRHQSMTNPLHSLLKGSFAEFFRDQESNNRECETEVSRESVDATDAFSEQTLELLQRVADKAPELKRNDLHTDHVLYVLANFNVCVTLLKDLKLSPTEIRAYIDRHAQA